MIGVVVVVVVVVFVVVVVVFVVVVFVVVVKGRSLTSGLIRKAARKPLLAAIFVPASTVQNLRFSSSTTARL